MSLTRPRRIIVTMVAVGMTAVIRAIIAMTPKRMRSGRMLSGVIHSARAVP